MLDLKVFFAYGRLVECIYSRSFKCGSLCILNRRQALAMVCLPAIIGMAMVVVAIVNESRNATIVSRARKHDAPNKGESHEGLSGRMRAILVTASLASSCSGANLIARTAPWWGSKQAASTKLVVATTTLHQATQSMIY